MPEIHRLSPSGKPLGLTPVLGDGMPFMRRMTAAYNTVEYRPAAGALAQIEGPAGVNPAMLAMVVPQAGTFRVFAHLSLAVRFLTPTAPPAPNSTTLGLALQQNVNGAGWGDMLFLNGDPASGNGADTHVIGATTDLEQDESFSLDGDHIFVNAAAGDIIQVRAVWNATAGGFQDIVSSYASENFANGGWHFQAYLAEEPAAP